MSYDHKAYLKERREWLHEHHFCVDCKKQDAFTMMGKWRCAECYEKAQLRRRKLSRVKKADRTELGLCLRCGKPNTTNMEICAECHEHFFAMSAKAHQGQGKPQKKTDHSSNPPYPRKEWIERGFCFLCGDPQEKGYKVCANCRQRLIQQRIRQKENGQDAEWRRHIDDFFKIRIAEIAEKRRK